MAKYKLVISKVIELESKEVARRRTVPVEVAIEWLKLDGRTAILLTGYRSGELQEGLA